MISQFSENGVIDDRGDCPIRYSCLNFHSLPWWASLWPQKKLNNFILTFSPLKLGFNLCLETLNAIEVNAWRLVG